MSEVGLDRPEAGSKGNRAARTRGLIVGLAGLSLLAVAAAVLVNVKWISNLTPYGYLGIFVINIFAGGTVIVPIPALAVVFAFGGILNPFLVGLAAGLGEAVGSLGSYMAGCPANLGKRSTFGFGIRADKFNDWVKKRGVVALFISSAIPNPLFILIGAAAGAVRFPVWKYFLCCLAGKSVKGMMVAWCGALGIKAILKIFNIDL